jgi:hypothetical protein
VGLWNAYLQQMLVAEPVAVSGGGSITAVGACHSLGLALEVAA